MADDYELVSSKSISKLKENLEKLRGTNPGGASTQDLQESIDRLSSNLENMLTVFEEAAEEMKLEDKETEVIAQKIEPLMDKLDALIEQNKKIAQGIVAVADMINEMKGIRPVQQRQEQRPMQPRHFERPPMNRPPQMPQQFRMPEATTFGAPTPPGSMPPMRGTPPDARPLPNMPPTQQMPSSFDLPPIPEPPSMSPKEEKKGGGFLGIRFTK